MFGYATDDVKTAVSVAALVISLCGAVLSVLSFRMSKYIADRSYALSYQQDVSKWGSEVIKTFADIENLLTTKRDIAEFYSELYSIRCSVALCRDQGRLIFTERSKNVYARMEEINGELETVSLGKEHPVILCINDYVERVDDDVDAYKALFADAHNGLAPYNALRKQFIDEIRKAINLDRRINEAGRFR